MMAGDVLILDGSGVFFLQGEKRQNAYQTANLQRVFTRDKRLYHRTGSEILLDREVLKEVMDELRGKTAAKLKELNIILPHAVTWYQYLEVDELPKDINEAYEFVMWKIQKLLPMPKEHVELRIQTLLRGKDSIKLLVAVTFKGLLAALERAFADMGFVVPLITPPTVSFLNVFEQSLPVRGILIWMREKDYSMVCFIDGVPVFIREVDKPINLERIEPELFSFYSIINESFGGFTPDKVMFFDEMERDGLAEYFPENAEQLSYKGLITKSGSKTENLSQYISALGVL